MYLGLALLAFAAIASAVLSGVANAAPEPPPPAASSGPARPAPMNPNAPPSPGGVPSLALPTLPDAAVDAEEAPEKKTPATKKEEEWQKFADQYNKENTGLLDAFQTVNASGKMTSITDAAGIPVSSYRIYSDTGDWKSWDLKIEAFLVDACFMGIKYLVCFACFLVSWALGFSLAGIMLRPALHVSDSLYSNVLVQMGVPGVALTFALTVASYQLLLGNRTRGWGNLVASLVISALAIGALASPPELLLSKDTGAVASAHNLAIEAAALVLESEAVGTDDEDELARTGQVARLTPEALSRPITNALVDALVVRPAMMLSYGRTFEGECGRAYQTSHMVQAALNKEVDEKGEKWGRAGLSAVPIIGPWIGMGIDAIGADASPDMITKFWKDKGPLKAFEKKCVPDASGDTKASMDKVVGANFMLLAALIICVFVIALTFGFLLAQAQIAFEAMLARVALVAGVLPGGGRGWLWTRVAAIGRGLALMVVAVLCLAVVIVLVNAITVASEKDIPGGITVRFILLDGICIAGFIFRSRLIRSTRAAVGHARVRLGSTPFGGTALASPPEGTRGRGRGGRLLMGGLLAATALATGGTSSAALGLGHLGAARSGVRLGGAVLLAGASATRGFGRAAGATAAAGARLGIRAGVLGLKSTVGLPVYGPRAVRRVGATVRALPTRITQQAGATAQRFHAARRSAHAASAPARAFVGEYRHNIRSLGHIMRGRGGLGPYVPPRATPHPAPRGSATSTSRTRRTRHVSSTLPVVGTPAPPRTRLAPPRTTAHARPQSAAQAMLQARLHRAQARRAAQAHRRPRP